SSSIRARRPSAVLLRCSWEAPYPLGTSQRFAGESFCANSWMGPHSSVASASPFSFRTPKYSCSEGARKSASTRQTVPAAWDASISPVRTQIAAQPPSVLRPGEQRDSRRILFPSEENALHQPEFFLTRNQFASCIFVEASCPNLSPVGLATRFALVYPGARR